MIIGFTQRRQTVSEADRAHTQNQSFLISVDVRSTVYSEINYTVSFEAPASNMGRTATVGDNGAANMLDYDALFGYFNAATGDLDDQYVFVDGSTNLSDPLTLTIVNDYNPEAMECFTIGITTPDESGNMYECFDENDDMDLFFCLHEICIEDDDG